MKRSLAPFAILALLALPAQAATLDDVAAAMGSGKLNNLQYSGSGSHYLVGQSQRAGGAWPKFPLTKVARTLDYANAGLLEEYIFVQPPGPMIGGGAQPFAGDQRRVSGLMGDTAWNAAGQTPTAQPGNVGNLQHEYTISAHGIVRAALADKVTATSGPNNTTVFSIERAGKFRAKATANAQNLVETVESVIANPVFGDMVTVTTYSDYRDLGGIKVPHKIAQQVTGHNSLEVTIAEAKVNAGGVTAPAQAQPPVPGPAATIEKVQDGVWLIAGSHNSVAIELAAEVVLFEAPLSEARVTEVIELIKKTIPNKPIRTAINTHHHFDHSGGLRAAAAEGATIVTHELNKGFYEAAYATPRTYGPDKLSRANGTAKFQTVGDKVVTVGDAARSIELHTLTGLGHVDGMLVGYLPKEKILIVADAYSARAPQPVTQRPAQINEFVAALYANIERLKLDIATVIPIHGRVAKFDELKVEAGKM
jgi:glyoxylase-like metal-dependent hydrolase (beta-lactamase superfamily II)